MAAVAVSILRSTTPARGPGSVALAAASTSFPVANRRSWLMDTGCRVDLTTSTAIPHNQRSSLYKAPIRSLLEESGLLYSVNGSRRSTYCFRHTYATFRLMEGIDVYFLAKQMGTSVKMIEDHYGHITPAKNAERILAGIPGWEPLAEGDSGERDASPKASRADSVNAGAAGKAAKKPRKK